MEAIEFVEFIRGKKCVVCFENAEPDHLNAIGMGRNRKKPDLEEHYSCVPLCRMHHTKRHSIGIEAFNIFYKVNLWKENRDYLLEYFTKM